MNNWDNKPSITVVYGAPDVPNSAIGEVLRDMYESKGIKHWESSTVTFTGGHDVDISMEVVEDQPIDADHLGHVLGCLQDHIYNTKAEDWLSHQNDLLVDEAQWLWVDVAYGVYYGPNCVVEVYHVTI